MEIIVIYDWGLVGFLIEEWGLELGLGFVIWYFDWCLETLTGNQDQGSYLKIEMCDWVLRFCFQNQIWGLVSGFGFVFFSLTLGYVDHRFHVFGGGGAVIVIVIISLKVMD